MLDLPDLDAIDLADTELWDRPLVDVVRFNPAATTHPLSRITPEMAEGWPVKPGFACLVDHDTRRPLDGFFEYQLSMLDRGDWNANTNRSYAYALKPAAETLRIEGRPYRYMDDEVVTTTMSSLMQGRGRLGERVSGLSIEAYVRALARCVDYTNGAGMTEISLDVDAHVARGWQVASMVGADGRRIDTSRLESARRHMIRPLGRATRKRVEAALLMDPAKWHRDGPSSRPGVTFANGRRNGLRLIENLGLMYDEIMRPVVKEPDEEILMPVLRTKGADYRVVFALGRDVRRWQAYAAHERKACVKAARDIHGSNWDEPPQLLVNGLASGVHVGHATQPSSIQRDFRAVLEGLGMYDVVPVPDGRGGSRPVVLLWHCYHDLRHTYAHASYRAAKKRRDHYADDPLGFVQLRLGHADRLTTARIYLWPDLRKVSLVGDHSVAGTGEVIDA